VDSTAFHNNPNPWYTLVDMTARDTLLSMVRLKTTQDVSTVMQGFAVQINNAQAVAVSGTSWKVGNSNLVAQVGFDAKVRSRAASAPREPPVGL